MNRVFCKDLISIIVPVYNAEAYIKRCIESILNQTYKNIEIILINDGSIDKSGDICETYANVDNRIIVRHTENKGVSSARNLGISIANGKYIAFVDADDFVSPIMYENLHKALILYNANIAACRIKKYNGLIFKKNKNDEIKVLNSLESMKFLLNLDNGYACGPCNKLYKKDIVNKFNEQLSIAEDLLFNFEIYLNNKKNTVFLEKDLYFASIRIDSASRKRRFTLEHLKEINVWEQILNKVQSNKDFNSLTSECKYNLKNVVFATLVRLACDRNDNNKLLYYNIKKIYKNIFLMSTNKKIKDYIKLILFNLPYDALHNVLKIVK